MLRSNVTDWTAEELWQAYMHLTEAEAAFRIQKDDSAPAAGVAPDGGARAGPHPGLLPGLRAAQDAGGLVATCRPGPEHADARGGVRPDPEHRRGLADHRRPHAALRCVVRPDQAQTILLDHLGLELPHRLRIAKRIAEM